MVKSIFLGSGALVFMFLACKPGAKFDGGKSTDKKNKNEQPISQKKNTTEENKDPIPLGNIGNVIDPGPSEVVDGQEVFTDCQKCVNRAKKLAVENNFSTDITKSINMGFYKISPSRNLCDVHFMGNLSFPVDDHSGVDTVGNNQIILYCPCDCGWARN